MQKLITVGFFYFATSLILALALTPLVRMLAFKWNAMDRGGRGRKIHVGSIPRLGGMAIFLAFMIPFGFSLTRGQWDNFHDRITLILAASLLVFIIGVWDDIKGATIISRLVIEFAAAFIVFSAGTRIEYFTNPFGAPLPLGWLSLPVTLLWIVIITNAFNLVDGLDGLAAGTGIMVIAIMVLLNLGNPDMHKFITLFTLLGALLGFLVYNFPPASIFMGDSGSLFLGFFLAAYSIQAGFKASAAAAMAIPFIAFAVPLLDMVYAILRRWNRGLPLGSADREHIHHKLLEKGMSRRKALLAFYGLYFIILLAALVFIRSNINFSLVVLLLIVILAVAGLRLLGYLRFRDFFKENYHHFLVTRRRRYFFYLIKRFTSAVSRNDSWAELNRHLDKLFTDYEFSGVEIALRLKDGLRGIYRFSGKSTAHVMKLEFPLAMETYCCGQVIIRKGLEDRSFLCISELTEALAKTFCEFVRRHPDLESIDWELKNEDSGSIAGAMKSSE